MTSELSQITFFLGENATSPQVSLGALFLPEYFSIAFGKAHFAQMDLVFQVIQTT